MSNIYHIVRRSDWDAAVSSGTYQPGSLDHEGFIHCSKQWQILDVANSQYHGQTGLALLRIDTRRVVSEVRSEDCYNTGQSFPHIYGPLDVSAVVDVFDFTADEEGNFSLPPEVD